MIDLTNTWCEATEESYNRIGNKSLTNPRKDIVYLFKGRDLKMHSTWTHKSLLDAINYRDFKQVHIVKGEFEYVQESLTDEQKEELEQLGINKNSEGVPNDVTSNDLVGLQTRKIECPFTKHGFEKPKDADIKFLYYNGKIYATRREEVIVFDETGKAYAIRCGGINIYIHQWNLKPIKKEWYEDKNNFPTLIVTDEGMGVWVHYCKDGKVYDLNDNSYTVSGTTNWRLARKEEILNLYKGD